MIEDDTERYLADADDDHAYRLCLAATRLDDTSIHAIDTLTDLVLWVADDPSWPQMDPAVRAAAARLRRLVRPAA